MNTLQYTKNENEFPWRDKKIQSIEYAETLKDIGDFHKAEQVMSCGCVLTFRVNPETGEKRLLWANFCRDRLCPMCAWRLSLKCFNQVRQVMDYIEINHPNLVPVFLTLTIKNCIDEDLNSTIDTIFKSWHKLIRVRKVERAVEGWFRALEITYNRKEDTFHPHLHAILLVDKQYFTGENYIDINEWVRLWRRSAQLDYDPICDIRRIDMDDSKDKSDVIAEVAKYTIKDRDYLPKNKKLAKRLVITLRRAIRRRRLLAFGGIMKTVSAQLKLDFKNNCNLIDLNSDEEIAAAGDIIVWYYWNNSLKNYILKETIATVDSFVSSKGRDPP
jgi:plasmid rolling circle replication initiator protein Rep